jgi:hypothetical protein
MKKRYRVLGFVLGQLDASCRLEIDAGPLGYQQQVKQHVGALVLQCFAPLKFGRQAGDLIVAFPLGQLEGVE